MLVTVYRWLESLQIKLKNQESSLSSGHHLEEAGMKRYWHYLGILLALAAGKNLLAANGTHFLSLSAASGGMGGATTGTFVAPSDALLRNGATLGEMKLGVGRWALEADFHMGNNAVSGISTSTAQGAGTEVSSTAGLRFIPEIAAVFRPLDRLTLGLGLLAYAGGASDFRDQIPMTRVSGELRLMRIPLAASYEVVDLLRVSVTPFINYGELATNHSANLFNAATTTRNRHGDFAFGYQIGAQYGDPDKWTVGASYTSKFTHRYDQLIDLDGFGTGSGTAATPGELDSVDVHEPDVFGVGFAAKPTSALKLALDLRYVRWGAAELYGQLGWSNAITVALGAEYEINPQWTVRIGGAHGQSPQSSSTDPSSTAASPPGSFNEVQIQGHSVFPSSVALLNGFGLPAQAQTHFCLGAGYNVTEDFALDFSAILVSTNQTVRTGTNTLNPTIGGTYSFTTNQSQWSMAVGARFKM
jgi:long-subunit fatty acid transport protein